NLLCLDHFELFDLGLSLTTLSVFLLKVLEISHSEINKIIEVELHLFNLCFQPFDLLIQLVDVEPVDPSNWLLCEFEDILSRYRSLQFILERNEGLVDRIEHLVPCLMLLLELLVYFLFEENFLK